MTAVTPITHALDRSRAQVEPALRAAVERLDPANRAIAIYHLGWTEADGTPRLSGGGKAIRPTLALLSTEAAGAPADVGMPGAVAVELVHNFSLLHDDVMDGDVERRHRPTVWAVWGVPAAILAGDAMLALANDVVLEAPCGPAATRVLNAAVAELIRGQTEDLAFETRSWVGLDECRRMAAGKTGALLSASARIGAVLAGADDDVVEALGAYGAHVGMAFQLVDDLLGIWGDPAVTGKPVLSDLRSRKKSLPIAYVLSLADARAESLAQWLAAPDAGRNGAAGDEEELTRVATLVEQAGARQWVTAEAERQVEFAEAALTSVRLAAGPSRELLALARFVIDREA